MWVGLACAEGKRDLLFFSKVFAEEMGLFPIQRWDYKEVLLCARMNIIKNFL